MQGGEGILVGCWRLNSEDDDNIGHDVHITMRR